MVYDVIDSTDNKRFEIHIEGYVAFEDYEFFTTSQREDGIAYTHPNSTAKCNTLQYQATNAISLKTIAGCLKSKHFFGR